jgi:thiopurine S-methyltransferase
MDPSFWHRRWEKNEIGFHGSKPHPMLVAHFDALSLPKGSRVFVPLCGKTLDIHWLLAQGYPVVGAELSRSAVEQLFAELGVPPTVTESGHYTRFSADGIDILVGDIFTLTAADIGPIDAVYDRAALVALPEAMRQRYTAHLPTLAAGGPQLLICFDYDQSKADGPPFSVGAHECRRRYEDKYDLRQLSHEPVPGGLRGQCDAFETVWLLTPRAA